jgi:hypothetical protein
MQLKKKLSKMLEQVQSYKIIFIYLGNSEHILSLF